MNTRRERVRLHLLATLTVVALASTATATTGGRGLGETLVASRATENAAAAHHRRRGLERIGTHVEGRRVVRGHHVGPVVGVVAPGAGHLGRGLRSRRHAAVRNVAAIVIVGAARLLLLGVAVGRGRAVGPRAVHGGRNAGGCDGRRHVEMAVVVVVLAVGGGSTAGAGVAMVDAAILVLVAVGRRHDGGRGRGARRRSAMTDALLRGFVGEQ